MGFKKCTGQASKRILWIFIFSPKQDGCYFVIICAMHLKPVGMISKGISVSFHNKEKWKVAFGQAHFYTFEEACKSLWPTVSNFLSSGILQILPMVFKLTIFVVEGVTEQSWSRWKYCQCYLKGGNSSSFPPSVSWYLYISRSNKMLVRLQQKIKFRLELLHFLS